MKNEQYGEMGIQIANEFTTNIEADGDYRQKLALVDGKLYKETWDDYVPYIKEAKHYRDLEGDFQGMGQGALGMRAFSLPPTVLEFIVDKYRLEDIMDTPEARKIIFRAVEYDEIPGVCALKLFKHTNKNIATRK